MNGNTIILLILQTFTLLSVSSNILKCLSFTITPKRQFSIHDSDTDLTQTTSYWTGHVTSVTNHNNNDQLHRRLNSNFIMLRMMPNDNVSTNNNDTSIFFQDDECHDLCDAFADENVNNDIDTAIVNKEEEEEEVQSIRNNKDSVIRMENNDATTLEQTQERKKSVETVMENIELRWKIDENADDCNLEEDISTCSDACDECVGTGVTDCQFCKGSGWIDFGTPSPGTMGERLAKNNGGFTGTECPVCSDDGTQLCQKCMGSGWIAQWRLNGAKQYPGLRP